MSSQRDIERHDRRCRRGDWGGITVSQLDLRRGLEGRRVAPNVGYSLWQVKGQWWGVICEVASRDARGLVK